MTDVLPDWIAPSLAAWLPVLIAAVLGVLLAEALLQLARRVLQKVFAQTPAALTVIATTRRAAHAAAPLLALTLVLHGAPDGLAGLALLQRVAAMALIAAATWLVVAGINGFTQVVVDRHPVTQADNLDARRIHTQARVLSRTVVGLVIVIGSALMLMVLPGVRQIGTSLLASAGLVGIVAGFAARPVLGNLIAGLQIALAQPIRVDDVLIVEGEWGRVEEITGTYVVIRIWDDRRLIVPLEYFIQNPFQNWTRRTSDLIGSVFLWVDYRMPIQPLREQLKRILEDAPEWDGRVCVLQVTDFSEKSMQLRALVSTRDAGRGWDLRCKVREQLIAYMQDNYAEWLPQVRATLDRGDRLDQPGAPENTPALRPVNPTEGAQAPAP